MSLFRRKTTYTSPLPQTESEEQKQQRIQKEATAKAIEDARKQQALLQYSAKIVDIFKYYGYELKATDSVNAFHIANLMYSESRKHLYTKDSMPILLPKYIVIQVSTYTYRYMIFSVFDYADNVIDELLISGINTFSEITDKCQERLAPKPLMGIAVFWFDEIPYFTVE